MFKIVFLVLLSSCGQNANRVGSFTPTGANPNSLSANVAIPVLEKIDNKTASAGGLLALGIPPVKTAEGASVSSFSFYSEKGVIPPLQIKPNDGLITISIPLSTAPQDVKSYIVAKDSKGNVSLPAEFVITITAGNGTSYVPVVKAGCGDDIKSYTTGTNCN
jgi:hypothetical protein